MKRIAISAALLLALSAPALAQVAQTPRYDSRAYNDSIDPAVRARAQRFQDGQGESNTPVRPSPDAGHYGFARASNDPCQSYSPVGPYGSVKPSGWNDASGEYHSCQN